MEKRMIKSNNSIKNGYNETHGGAGGFSVPDHKLDRWKSGISKRTRGSKNPNAKSVSNEEILDHALQFFIDNENRLIRARWMEYSKEAGLPLTYTKYRFGGGYKNFLESFKQFLCRQGIEYSDISFNLTKEERYNEEVNSKISETLKRKNRKC